MGLFGYLVLCRKYTREEAIAYINLLECGLISAADKLKNEIEMRK
jgi:hypothetical protein